MADYDIAVIGGGINGVGIARDAAGRGLKVLLVEQGDLGGGTSSASTKLVHGGLRYLEHRAFGLVRESLAEREILLHQAPHLVRPIRIVLPVLSGARWPWMLRFGLHLYDWLAKGSSLPRSSELDLNVSVAGGPLRRSFIAGFEYSDCTVDDARLVIANAIDALERGATIMTHTRCVRLDRGEDWSVVLNRRGHRSVVTARVLINATGPWTALFSEMALRQKEKAPVRLVKGSHIVVPKLFDHSRAYIFQNTDRRIVFAIPFQRDYTLIGTTDTDFAGDLASVTADSAEINYLCDAVSIYFRDLVSIGDVVWAYAGVRPLYNNGKRAAQDTTRDHVVQVDTAFRRAPLVSLYGGKLTTYRSMSEEVVEKIASWFAPTKPWTRHAKLPGGDLGGRTLEEFRAEARARWPFLDEDHADRLADAYGSRIDRVLDAAAKPEDLGPDLGHTLTAAEVRYLMRHEWAETADDVLWRRTKLGLKFSRQQKQALAQFMAGAGAPAA
jgi:glycerol-3-phosphate dehydrogenase